MFRFLLGVLIGIVLAATAYNAAPAAKCEGPKAYVSLKDAGALSNESSCELSWAFCWERT